MSGTDDYAAGESGVVVPGRQIAIPEAIPGAIPEAVEGTTDERKPTPNQNTQLVAAAGTAAGTAIVSAAKMGRLMSRASWGIARRLPGGEALQREVERLQEAALSEARRLLEAATEPRAGSDDHETARVIGLLQHAGGTADPLRAAMTELLERSVEASRKASRDYLFGNIISQLVPDEARIVATLADGSIFAALDVVAKQRSGTTTVLANASTVGRKCGVSIVSNTPTYVTRLFRFGLIEFGPPRDDIAVQYELLATEAEVQSAVALIEHRRQGSPKLVRKTLYLSGFGREFWAACNPDPTDDPH